MNDNNPTAAIESAKPKAPTSYLMIAAEYHAIILLGEMEAKRQGKWPVGCPDGWDEAFVDTPNGYREIWDANNERNADGSITFYVGPNGRDVTVPGHATVKVRT